MVVESKSYVRSTHVARASRSLTDGRAQAARAATKIGRARRFMATSGCDPTYYLQHSPETSCELRRPSCSSCSLPPAAAASPSGRPRPPATASPSGSATAFWRARGSRVLVAWAPRCGTRTRRARTSGRRTASRSEPSPPDPLSALRRGGTTVCPIVPPLHEVERGSGGEVASRPRPHRLRPVQSVHRLRHAPAGPLRTALRGPLEGGPRRYSHPPPARRPLQAQRRPARHHAPRRRQALPLPGPAV